MKAGWQIACGRFEVQPNTGEVVITECLRDGMRAALKTGTLPWHSTMVVLPGTESRSAAEVLIPDGRTDIPIFVIPVFTESQEHDPHAIIECKRVAPSDSTLVREYVVSGIDRFSTGKYSATHSQGFMAGYIISGDIVSTVEAINTYLTKRGRITELLDESKALPSDWTRASTHPRVGSTIDLHHGFLLVA